MKKIFTLILALTLIGVVTFNLDAISDFLSNIISNNHKLVIDSKNNFSKEKDYAYVQISKDYIPYSYNDLLDIIYTVIDNGWESFTFYCPSEYKNCIVDIEQISSDDITLTHINNYVHPYNSFTNLQTLYSEAGEITFNVDYLYTDEQINVIENKINEIISTQINPNNSDYDNIKAVHDYIINNTKYDISQSENTSNQANSYNAYGLLTSHLATCNGYTDTMAIILNKMNIPNYKIATTADRISYKTTGHVWNAVYLDGTWLHLDLTWDDPVSESGQDYLYHKYFLVNNKELEKADDGDVAIEEHNFDKSIYLEFNDSIKDIIS